MYFTIDLSLNYSHILNHKTALDADFSINRKTPYCFMLTWHLQNSSFTKSNYSFHLCHNLIGVVFSLHLAHMVTMLVPVCAGGDWRLGTEVPILPSSSIHHLDPPPSSSRLRSPLVRHTWGHLATLHLVGPLVELFGGDIFIYMHWDWVFHNNCPQNTLCLSETPATVSPKSWNITRNKEIVWCS